MFPGKLCSIYGSVTGNMSKHDGSVLHAAQQGTVTQHAPHVFYCMSCEVEQLLLDICDLRFLYVDVSILFACMIFHFSGNECSSYVHVTYVCMCPMYASLPASKIGPLLIIILKAV